MRNPRSRAQAGLRRVIAVVASVLAVTALSVLPALAGPAHHHLNHARVRDWNISADGTSSVTTASGGSVAAGDTLVAYVEADAAGAGSQTATVSGCGQAWHLLARQNAQAGDAEAWYVTGAAAQSSCAVTALLAHSGYQLSLTAADYGATGTPTAATGHAASGAASVTVSSIPSGSALWLAGNDWDNAISRTLLAGDSSVHQKLTSSGDTYWTEQQAAAASGTQAIGTSAPAGDQWNAVAVVIPPASLAVPGAPTGLTVTGTTSSSASLSWTAPAGTVTGYDVYRNGTQVGTPSAASYTDTGLAASTTYTYTVAAYNSAGTGPQSSSVQGTTLAASGCDLNATTSNFASQVSAATAGQVICLASGNYGTWTGTNKAITVKAASGAAPVMTDSFGSGASGFTLDGMTGMSGTISGTANNITVKNSSFTGEQAVLMGSMEGAGIVFTGDTFNNFLGTARFWAQDYNASGSTGSVASGVIVENSTFTGTTSGGADGVRCDGASIQILNNDFSGINDAASGGNHGDPIQIYGGTHCIIKGNYFHGMVNSATCSLGEWDGGDHNVFEDNVVDTGGCYEAVALLADQSSVVNHNTFIAPTAGCFANPQYECASVSTGAKTGSTGSGTVYENNVMAGIDNGNGGVNASYTENHNLCLNGCGSGTGDITGAPTLAGGAQPVTFGGFALAAGSLGISGASDGTNMGIELPTGG